MPCLRYIVQYTIRKNVPELSKVKVLITKQNGLCPILEYLIISTDAQLCEQNCNVVVSPGRANYFILFDGSINLQLTCYYSCQINAVKKKVQCFSLKCIGIEV